MSNVVSKLYDETYPVGLLAAEIQQVLLERDIWKKAADILGEVAENKLECGGYPAMNWAYEQAKKAMEQA